MSDAQPDNSGIPPGSAPASHETPSTKSAGDPDDLEASGEWDAEKRVQAGAGHYNYGYLLADDRKLRLLYLFALTPLPFTLAEMVVFVNLPRGDILPGATMCLMMSGMFCAFALQRWPAVAAMVGYALYFLLQLLALGADPLQAKVLGGGGLVVLAGAVIAWLFYRDVQERLQHRRYPAEVHEMAGRMRSFFALRAWVKLQREADQAEQSTAWQGEPGQPLPSVAQPRSNRPAPRPEDDWAR